MAPSRTRWATPADNDALVALVRECPMEGEVGLYFDRSPDFFALSRLQGDGAKICVVEATDGRIVGCAALAHYPAMYVDGVPHEVTYACDLRIHPAHRRGFVAKRIHNFLEAHAHEQGLELMFASVMRGNQAMSPVLQGKAGLVPYHPLATVRNYTVQFLLPRRSPRGIEVRRATADDVPAMRELWTRRMSALQFAPVPAEPLHTEAGLGASGPGIEAHFVALRDGQLTGSLLCWDQRTFKRLRVLSYGPRLQRMRRWFNPIARLVGRTPLPDPGSVMPYFYAVRPCAESVADLRALYVAVHNSFLKGGYVFFSTMFDVRDPMAAALKGFTTEHVDIDLFLIDPARKWQNNRFGERICYFDPSMV